MTHHNLLFLHNELMSPVVQKEMRLPLSFVSYGLIRHGKMYKHFRSQSNFVLLNAGNRWGNDVVYGALFLCTDFDFYSRILDAYHVCSLSTLLKNHRQDIHHRVSIEVFPIHFESLDELARLKYREAQPVMAQMYMGNPNHPKITQRLNKTNSYRIVEGLDAEHLKQLWEVTGCH